jgi:putative restriction endonuclease
MQSHWLEIFGKLRVNRSQGLAPQKRLLLLVVLEMIEKGELETPLLSLTPELVFRFSQFGGIVSHRRTQRMDIRLPFYHLSSDGVSAVFNKDGLTSLDPRSTQYVRISDELFSLAQDIDFRTRVRAILIRTYFEPAVRLALASLGQPPDC